MNSLADAWNWYEATRRNLRRMQRLGRNHWDDPSLEGASLWRDDEFRTLEGDDIVEETTAGLKRIDELAVVLLFSMFEASVRDHLTAQIRPEADRLTQPILREAAKDALRGVGEGSFYRRVLEPLKQQKHLSADLVTRVDQVRDYCNCVAHGRPDESINNVTPQIAYDRLREFLAALGISVEPEQEETPHE